ncbi:hypothetical protein CYMTET_56483, partial [Cymbomonas tetramitiformis]
MRHPAGNTVTLIAIFILLAAGDAWPLSDASNPLVLRRDDELRDSLLNRESLGYDVRVYQQQLSHFNAQVNGTFPQRYLVNSTFWAGAARQGPIFVFTGAEGGDVERTAGAYGWVTQMARRSSAMLVFLEHRFFGKSLPFGPDNSYVAEASRVGLLSVEEALADYSEILHALRDELAAWHCPLMTFGGSLAGTLSAFMRIKYPGLVDLALASSSPIRGYLNVDGISQFSWRKQITDNFESFAPGCPELVRQGFRALQYADSEELHRAYNTCDVPGKDGWEQIQSIVWSKLEGIGEFCYPPERAQIKPACQRMGNAGSPLGIFASLINTPPKQCLNLTRHGIETPDQKGWLYLACTEIIHPIGANNVTDMFPPFNFSLTSLAESCAPRWHAAPRPYWLPKEMAIYQLERLASSTSHILFTYGTADPWHTLGLERSLSSKLPVIFINGGSHCADVAAPQDSDTAQMKTARQ